MCGPPYSLIYSLTYEIEYILQNTFKSALFEYSKLSLKEEVGKHFRTRAVIVWQFLEATCFP